MALIMTELLMRNEKKREVSEICVQKRGSMRITALLTAMV